MARVIIFIMIICSFTFQGLSENISVVSSLPDTTVLLKGIEVHGKSKHPYVRPVTTIEQQAMQSIPTVDAATILSSMANVGGVRKGPSTLDPVVRGFRAGQLNVQLNGGMLIEGGCPNRMDPTSSHVSTDRIATIQVLKGPYAFRYGPNMGGVVRLLTIEPRVSSNPHFEVQASKRMETNWNANTENVSVAWRAKQFAANAFAGRSKYNDYTSGSGESVPAAFNKYHYGSGLRYKNNKHQITLTADASHAYNVHYPALPMDERIDDTYFTRADYQFTQNTELFEYVNINLYHSRVHHLMDNKERPFSDTVAAVSDIHTTAQGYRIETLLKPRNLSWYVGADGSYITKNGMRTKNFILQPPVNGNIPEKREQLWNNAFTMNNGIFTEISKKYENWFWIMAARGDINSAASDTILTIIPGAPEPYITTPEEAKSVLVNYSFSAGISRFFKNELSLGLSLGRAMRSPDMTERFIIMLPVGYDNYDYLGNPDLKAETNNEADLTLMKSFDNIGTLSTGLFVSYISNYITAIRVPKLPLSADVLGVKQFTNGEKAILYGFECSWSSSRNNLVGIEWNAAMTYGSIYNIEKTVIDEYGSVTGTTILPKDALAEIPPFETNMTISLQKPQYKINPSVSLRYVAAQKHVSEAYHEQPSEGFLLMNARIFYRPIKGVDIIGGVNNLFDSDYYEHLNRRVIGTTAYMPEPGRVWYIQINLTWK